MASVRKTRQSVSARTRKPSASNRAPGPRVSKSERIEIRADAAAKALLLSAASASHKSVTEFLLDAGLAMAAETLADRRLFQLSDEDWRAFNDALDRPVTPRPRLAALLSGPSVLE